MTDIILDGNFRAAAIHAFKTAKSIIQISTFKLELFGKNIPKPVREIADALTAALTSGVKVEMLVNWKDSRAGVPRTNDCCAVHLIQRGARVRYLPSGRCIHAKIILIDGSYAILGSHNLSVRSMISNFESSIAVNDPPTVHALTEEFARLFVDAKSF